MKPTIWEFVALVDDAEGQEIKVDVALRIDRIQSIVKESDDSVVIYCDGGLTWRPFDWRFDLLVRAWANNEPLNDAFDVSIYRNWSDEKWWQDVWEQRGESDKSRKSEFLAKWRVQKGWIDRDLEIGKIMAVELEKLGARPEYLTKVGYPEWTLSTECQSESAE